MIRVIRSGLVRALPDQRGGKVTVQIHSIAAIWPEMSSEEWADFAADVATNGLLTPIVTWRGAVVDGKHRQRACEAAGVEPRYDALDATWDEWRVVLHCMSLHRRRNLDATQRACVAALALARYQPAARERIAETTRASNKRRAGIPATAPGRELGTAARAAAAGAGSSERSVERAAFVAREAPEAFELARAGKMTLKVAERVAKKAPEDRAAVLAQLTTSVRTEAAGDSWGTPPEWIALARTIMGAIDMDPASNDDAQRTVQAAEYFTSEDDGLAQDWRGRIWLNPPYSQPLVGDFSHKLMAEIEAGRVKQACVLVNNTTDTHVGQTLLGGCAAALFPKGRVSFLVPGTTTALEGTRQGQMFLYFGANVKRFVSACAGLGWIGVAP